MTWAFVPGCKGPAPAGKISQTGPWGSGRWEGRGAGPVLEELQEPIIDFLKAVWVQMREAPDGVWLGPLSSGP